MSLSVEGTYHFLKKSQKVKCQNVSHKGNIENSYVNSFEQKTEQSTYYTIPIILFELSNCVPKYKAS